MKPNSSHHGSDGQVTRRALLAAGVAGTGLLRGRRVPVSQAIAQAAAENERLRITDIENHEITVPYEDWIAYELNHFYGPTRRTVYLVHSPLGAGFETQRRAADGYILGHSKIGDAIRRAGLFAQLELPFSLQNVGGTITRAMTVHMQAAFKTAHLHFNSDTETWKADVVQERLEPVNGLIRVPERPGLGLTLDRAELERLKALKLPEQPKWIIETRYANGTMMYNMADPHDSLFMVRPDKRRMVTLNYDAPLTTEYWDPDGTPAFRDMFQRLEKEGMVLERP